MSDDRDFMLRVESALRSAGVYDVTHTITTLTDSGIGFVDMDDAPEGLKGLEFGAAIAILKQGGSVTRAGWNGANQFLELQVPDVNSKMSLPYIFINTVQGDRVPWLASQTDMLATDWEVRF